VEFRSYILFFNAISNIATKLCKTYLVSISMQCGEPFILIYIAGHGVFVKIVET
jgi:hypothetical protein